MFAIKSIRLKNFKCYSDATVSFSGKNNSVKHLIITYGANGCGKTTLLESIAFLYSSINTLLQQKRLQETIQGDGQSFSDMPLKAEYILKSLEYSLKRGSLESLISNSISSACDGNLELSFEFWMDDSIAVYSIVTTNKAVVSERLDFPLNKNRTCCFNISAEEKYINENLVVNEEYRKQLYNQLDKLYGVHSFLAILNYECDSNAEEFIYKSFNHKFIDFTNQLKKITISLHDSNFYSWFDLPVSTNRIIESLDSGIINKDEEALLNEIESALPDILKSIFKDIKEVWFERNVDSKNKDRIKYKLFVKRRINGQDYIIPFNKESSGTKRFLSLIPLILSAMQGNLVVVDEYGEDLHEKLAHDVLESISKCITGQIILSTHMTGLLNNIGGENSLKEEYFYFIKNDPDFPKTVSCLTDIEKRLHKNYNYQDRYFYNPLFEQYLPDSDTDIGEPLAYLSGIGKRDD